VTALFWGIASFAGAAVALAAYLPLARRLAWVDSPNHRSSHERATPGSGGVAVIAALLVTVAVALFLEAPATDASGAQLAWLLAATTALCAMGAWDDRRPLPAGLRLATTLVLCAGLQVVLLAPVTAVAWAFALALAVALAWFVNLYNFMDGIDGLAAAQCVLAAVGLAMLAGLADAPAGRFQLLALSIGGAYLAFLLFNWPPARLFMGDAGSLSAGLLLGWLGLWGWREGWVAPAVWLLLMSPFVIDASWTLIARALRGARITEAHREHLYQRLARRWASHRRVTLALVLMHLVWLQPLALLISLYPGHSMTFLVLGLFPQLLLMASARRLK
jgi:Fuc2NAc and GlcNAc transferase